MKAAYVFVCCVFFSDFGTTQGLVTVPHLKLHTPHPHLTTLLSLYSAAQVPFQLASAAQKPPWSDLFCLKVASAFTFARSENLIFICKLPKARQSVNLWFYPVLNVKAHLL